MRSRVLVVAVFALFTAATLAELGHLGAHALREPTLHAWLVAGYWALKLAVVAAFTYFIAIREPARRPSRDPRAFAVCTAAIVSAVALSPPADTTPPGQLLGGEALALAGVVWVLVSVLALGRCFGVLPEARGLVTRGPYRVVRHPVYLGEVAACAGLMIAALSPANVGCFAVLCIAQRVRMGMEERALRREFPEYGAYAVRTPRVIPWTAPAPMPSTTTT
jgi:protein-S-isoprenylcysteine O-methyltransferase Ste14